MAQLYTTSKFLRNISIKLETEKNIINATSDHLVIKQTPVDSLTNQQTNIKIR